MPRLLSRFLSDSSGATAVEFGIIGGLIVLGLAGALLSLQAALSTPGGEAAAIVR